jgi:hypothetical protein
MTVNLERLEAYRSGLELYKIKTFSDLELFLMSTNVSNREKLETLYVTYAFYNEIMNYIEERINSIT